MDKIYHFSQMVLDREIGAVVQILDMGIWVTVTGGDQTHIGAVGIIDNEENERLVTLPGHRETIICNQWMHALHNHFHVPVVVAAGIHYDGISKEAIEHVLQACSLLLEQIKNNIPQMVHETKS